MGKRGIGVGFLLLALGLISTSPPPDDIGAAKVHPYLDRAGPGGGGVELKLAPPASGGSLERTGGRG